jgi:SAM-dependent MidA family methyltransferase
LTQLEELLRARIRQAGPLPFREVMQAALYHPQYGYYTNLRGFGANGDFITSPERHPAFGWLLGRQALDVWEALERRRPFIILELGAGSGALAQPLVEFLSQHVPEIVYAIEEPSPSLRAVQQARLTRPEFTWGDVDDKVHFLIANEVADALPVHRVVMRQGRLRELRVGIDEGESFVWVETDSARPELEAYFQALHYQLPEGHAADICLELADWVRAIAQRIDRGVALVIDYAASPPRDSLLTYYRHTMGSDPLIRLGQQDISVHVDLRTLVRLAIGEGLRAGATAQRGLLLNLGFEQVHSLLSGQTDRRALGHLVDPNGAGGQIAAVFLVRGLPEYRPAGAVGREWPEPIDVPSLPPDQDEAEFLDQWHEAFAPPGDSANQPGNIDDRAGFRQ